MARTSEAWSGSDPRGGAVGAQTLLSQRDFQRLSSLIEAHCGIRMPLAKKVMLESRLRRRLRALGLQSFGPYCELVLRPDHGGPELIHLVDAVTTNKTDFFREAEHFEYLTRQAVPSLLRAQELRGRELRLWSAGCSTGEEPYTLAMVLAEFAGQLPSLRFRILATDISTQVLRHAERAIYAEERVEPVPLPLRQKYLLRSRDRSQSLVRIVPALRDLVRFARLNFLGQGYGLPAPMDVIFCRNVLIYFERSVQCTVIRQFCDNLVRGGYLFLGHSETINGLDVPLTMVAPTVYRRC